MSVDESRPPPSGTAKPDLGRLRIDDRRRPRRRGSMLPLVVVLALVAGVAYLARGLWRPLVDRFTLPEVEVVQVELIAAQAAPPGALTANGYVVAQRRAALAAKLTGRLQELLVLEGVRVKQGEVVARLEHTDLDAQLKRAEADVAQARAEVARQRADGERYQADLGEAAQLIEAAVGMRQESEALVEDDRSEFQRQAKLREQGLTTEEAYDRARAELRAQEARVIAAKARESSARARIESLKAQLSAVAASVELAEAGVRARAADLQYLEAQLEFHTIRAPFDGVVISKDAEVGEIVAPISGGALARVAVVTIVDMDSLMVEADVNEASIGRIATNQPARITLDAFPDVVYEGSVFKIVPTANRQKATVEVKVAFKNPDQRIIPEMAARVFFVEETQDATAVRSTAPRLFLAERAVGEEGGSFWVWVVKDGEVVRRTIQVGERGGSKVEIESGLASGDRVVVPSQDVHLADGMKVREASRKN